MLAPAIASLSALRYVRIVLMQYITDLTARFTGREPEYMKLNIQFTIDVVLGGITINLFPNVLKP